MRRIAPSERIDQELDRLLQPGLDTSEQPVSALIRLAAQKIVQQALEQEVADVLGRDR